MIGWCSQVINEAKDYLLDFILEIGGCGKKREYAKDIKLSESEINEFFEEGKEYLIKLHKKQKFQEEYKNYKISDEDREKLKDIKI